MLIDTSVWIDHLRRRNAPLVGLLEQARVWTHAFVIGELACGNLARRGEVLTSLAALPHVPVVPHGEVLAFIDARRLAGRGLGWIDVHLLAAATLARIPFWTLDKRLASVAAEFHLQVGE
ncbi:MAG: type II toxin-antitoxin system VapC family toxin [Steroidobacteraceae bacterium]